MLFPTPRYNAEGLSVLIQRLESNIMLVPEAPLPVVAPLLTLQPHMTLYQVPQLNDLLSPAAIPSPYPYNKIFAEAKHDPLTVLHTSGTTGFPKPIIWTHEWADTLAQVHYLPPLEGFKNTFGLLLGKGVKILSLMPPFHASGFFGALFFPLHTGSTIVLPPSGIPPSATLARDILEVVYDVDTLAVPPPYIEELGNNEALLEEVSSKTRSVFWIGGDVSESAGEKISQKTRLWTALGSTEMGVMPLLRSYEGWNSYLWHYVRYHPAYNLAFEPASSSGEETKDVIYEAVIKRNGSHNLTQPIFKLFPELQEYRTGDLFVQHPKDLNLWRHYGRADDLIIFASDEGFHPTAIEQRIQSHPAIEEVMMVGTMRPAAALILRPKRVANQEARELQEEGDMLDGVWGFIESLNPSLPVYAKLRKDLALIVDKEFLKTAKGSLRRKTMVEIYNRELDELYESVGRCIQSAGSSWN
jgi:acyl-coenzyme A synthetase/AMP-(fatty) acid ligase